MFSTSFDLDRAARGRLWSVVRTYLFGAAPAALPLVWVADPIGGDPARLPPDAAALLECWFTLVESADVRAFLDAVAAALPPSLEHDFVADCNEVLGATGAALRVA
jgi:hypothetical protein